MKRKSNSGETENHTFYFTRERYPLLAKFLGVSIVEEWECIAHASWYTSYEKADADGNRGEWVTHIDDYEVEEYSRNGKYVKSKDVPDEVYNNFDDQIGSFDDWRTSDREDSDD